MLFRSVELMDGIGLMRPSEQDQKSASVNKIVSIYDATSRVDLLSATRRGDIAPAAHRLGSLPRAAKKRLAR